MEKEKIAEELRKLVSENTTILLEEDMAKHTSFKTGGKADVYCKVACIEDLKAIKKIVDKFNIPMCIIGNGSNVLVRDGGIRGIVVKLNLQQVTIQKEDEGKVLVTAQAGIPLTVLARKLQKEGVSGLEFASGIPGTVGGAIRMNAGAHGGEMKDVIKTTTYMNSEGKIKTIENQTHAFAYRDSMFVHQDNIILETTLELEQGNKEQIENKMKEYAEWRKEKQPIEYPSAGSTFKRGDGFITAMLIDQCGLKGYQIGGAEVSTKHAGFIINKENATTKDILELIDYVKEQVKKKFDKDIELEVQVIGEEN